MVTFLKSQNARRRSYKNEDGSLLCDGFLCWACPSLPSLGSVWEEPNQQQNTSERLIHPAIHFEEREKRETNQLLPTTKRTTMGEKKVTETTNTQVSGVQPYVLHSPLVIAIEKFAWRRRRQVTLSRGQKPGQVIHNSDGSTTKVISVKAL